MLNKLKLNKEFRRAYSRGDSFVNAGFVTYVFRTRGDEIRFGITVSKKLGGAVLRNRAKRLITAAFRECKPNIKGGCDFVFVARNAIFKMKSYDIAEEMKKQFISAELWKENDQ